MSTTDHHVEMPASRGFNRDTTSRVGGQDVLNLRPLPNRLGYNGPYYGHAAMKAVDWDCDRIEGHSGLFRDVETFEADLRKAITVIWDEMTALSIIRHRIAEGAEQPETAMEQATYALTTAFQYMQEAYLVTEILDERERRRLRERDAKDFLALIPTKPREQMTSLECLAEEGELTWKISALLDRMGQTRGAKYDWPKPGVDQLKELTGRLEKALMPPTTEELEDMPDDALSAELRALEEKISDMRQSVSLIHALRLIRRNRSQEDKGASYAGA
ncbi:hypothetical protein NOF55_00145 [Rhizobiaceae bacterium BDR2-2]|uniref:Uncharacterized protein n=1 Tax=Ectorhizobium quercum TaxID=2965071 RepID=A0AAE3STZ1_9HYPH|nr:hypothetical protein [Ectorhizobium quercum]MCX8995514.1 hypothetical protein [Ectorhizobium quercum]